MEYRFSTGHLLLEIALIAIALAAGRVAFFSSTLWVEAQAICYCLTIVSACGAIGGVCLRMAFGLIAGAVFASASIPLVWLLISAA